MDFPIFHLDFFGNRMLIAVIAVLHVIVNHSMAVGAMPLITWLEYRAWKKGDQAQDQLAYRLLFVCFVVTTSLGALTGVGIWFSASLVNPYAIASLIRVFFWGWFTEWIIFILEVCFIMLYFLTWKKWQGKRKLPHILVGTWLSIFSWLTMAIIVAILGFMMHAGQWEPFDRVWTPASSLLTAVLNPIYLPQLAFRTPLAMITAGLFFMFLVPFFTRRNPELRHRIIRQLGIWVLCFLPFCLAGSLWYYRMVPEFMTANFPIAVATQNYADWYGVLNHLILGTVIAIGVVAAWGALKPGWLPRPVMLLPFLATLLLLGTFERAREFVRKPYIIYDYMYANGLRVEDYPLYKEDGILPHATYRQVVSAQDDPLKVGEDVFALACTRCHTTTGLNGVTHKLEGLFGIAAWDQTAVASYLSTMHNTRPYMPPIPGSDAEREALAAYLCSLQENPRPLPGAQTVGLPPPPGS